MENKNVLIIFAHPEKQSFCGSMASECEKYFKSKNCIVTVRDLYELNFNPVAGQDDFTKLSDNGKKYFQLSEEQKEAYKNGNISDDIKTEINYIKNSDFICFVFPFWWSSFPAILKGYIDRVLIQGFAFDINTKTIYNNGLLKGKSVKLFLTTGGAEELYTESGLGKTTVEERLEHITYGALAFCGLNVYHSFVAHGVSPVTPKEKLNLLMGNLRKCLENIDKENFLYQMNQQVKIL